MRSETEQLRTLVGPRRDHRLTALQRHSTADGFHTTPSARGVDIDSRPAARLPFVVYVLALGTFLMGTTEFMTAGLLPEVAGDLEVPVAQAGMSITVFAVGMVVGAPLMSMLTLRLPKRLTLIAALGLFAAGHALAAAAPSFDVLLAARFVSALATGAFWAVGNVVAARIAGPGSSARALGVVGAGAMLANVVGVPLGAVAGQLAGWRGPFWALAVLAIGAMALMGRHVPHDGPGDTAGSLRSELAALRSGRVWLVLAACATTTGGVLAAYSYISPLLTDQAGLAAGLVPLVLVGFGVGTLAGSLIGGRLSDARPYATAIAVPAVSTALLLGICLFSHQPALVAALVVLLGFGLGGNPGLISMAVRFAGRTATLASALTVAAFNFGTAVGSLGAGLALDSELGAVGPAVVGTAIVALTLIPTTAIAVTGGRRVAVAAT